ncbi:TPA: hypothetical protein U2N26_001846 [Acinetobacter nosocomialis]|uniref:Uncharacterized protein n=1 Tax=Acinetobacter nosocomialis TaxID=106654 RepID=A0AB36M501_ACINO|nr:MULTISPECIES: hypothetical protein [Acinetobacter calcoaceticus/baumannii complex]MBJ8460953.1 hypothetical protein [Acinetobacter nosocomialis]OTL99774.1 hypothetical protein B9X58_04460 [Acinetobacter nosocomialis]HCD61621.1 hypothetical protein [Acinetobacter nosocomialis]HDG9822780.1 hypothetical protein [Acinetobacter nosocomialis]HEM6633699.1 hypothetical protein [Acinetobacter nosocomialis]
MTPLNSSPRLLSFCFKLVLVLLLAYLLLSGFYMWMIGGTAIYVSSAVLLAITAYAFKLGKYQKLCAVLNVLMSALALYFSTAHLFFSPIQFFIFLPALFFVMLAFTRLSKVRSLSKVLIFISLLVWSGIHFSQLKQLQAYYKTQHTGESWQQYGAL